MFLAKCSTVYEIVVKAEEMGEVLGGRQVQFFGVDQASVQQPVAN